MPLLVRRALFLLAIGLIPMSVVLWHGQSTKRELGETLAEQSAERLRAEREEALALGLKTAAEALASQLSQTALTVQAGARVVEHALARAEALGLDDAAKRRFVDSRIEAAGDQVAAQASIRLPWRATVFEDRAAGDGGDLPAALVRPGTDARDAQWYRSAKLLGGTVWDGPRPGPEPGSLVVVAATPVRGPGRDVAGVSAAGFDVADSLVRAAERLGIAGARVSVVQMGDGGDGPVSLLATSDPGAPPWTERAAPETIVMLADALSQPEREVHAFTIADEPYLFASEPVFRSVAHLVAVVPYASIDAVVREQSDAFDRTTWRHLSLTAIVAAAVIAVVALIALASARRQARPIQELADAVRRIGRGDFGVRLTPKRGDELGLLAVAVNRFAPALAERLRMHRDLDLAVEVQTHLLPAAVPDVPGLDIAFSYRASDRMGGDYIDFLDTGFGPAAIVADVSGHGAAAALLMATARAFVRARAPGAKNPGDLLTRLNADLARDVSGGRFMTAFCLALRRDGPPVWAGAGHHPALLMDGVSGAIAAVEADAIPLGIDAGTVYGTHELASPPGPWTLVVATDGLEETKGPGGRLGRAGVERALGAATGTAGEVVATLLAARDDHAGGADPADDVTVLVVRRA